MQSSSASTASFTSTPTPLHGLQERARAGLQATSQIMKEQVDLARQAGNDRLKIAQNGKKLLDEGGETSAQAVLAKKASINASDSDKSIATQVHIAIAKLDDSVAKLKVTQPAHHSNEIGTDGGLWQLANEHEARVTIYKQIAQMLQTPASSAEMSPEECDALAIVQTRMGCASMMHWTAEGLESVRQKALANIAFASAEQSARGEHAQRLSSETAQRPTLLQGFHAKAQSDFQKVKEAANDRIDTARAGKRLLDNGGESVARVVLAKKAVLDAAEIDRDIAQRVRSAIVLFHESSVKLRELKLASEAEGVAEHSVLAKLAEEHELRANTYRQIAGMLETPTATVEMSLTEWDALSVVKVKGSCDALQCRTNEGFEVVKGMLFSSCAGGSEHLDRQRKTVCA